MISKNKFDKIVDAAESVEWYVSWGKELTADKKHEIEFRYSSPAGEDFSFTVFANSLDELITRVEDEYYSFDISEHAVSWYGRNNGEPSGLRELLDDATNIQAAIGELVAELNKLVQED